MKINPLNRLLAALCLVVLWLAPAISMAQVSNVTLSDVTFLIDPAEELKLKYIKSNPEKMQPAIGTDLSWNLPEGRLWLKFKAENKRSSQVKVWLETGNNYPKDAIIIQKIPSLFPQPDWQTLQRLSHMRSTDNLNQNQTVGAWITLQPNQTVDLILSISTNRASNVKLQLLTESQYYRIAFNQRTKLALTIGVLLSLTVLSILFYLSTRKAHYLFYGGLELATVGYFYSETGFGLISFWPNMNVMSEHLIYFFGSCAFLCFMWFGYHFLSVAKNFRLVKPVYYITTCLIVFSMALSLDASWHKFLLNFFIPTFIFIFLIMHLVLGVLQIFNGQKYVWPYVVGILAEWVSSVAFFLKSYGLMGVPLGEEYDVVYAAILIEGILFLVAMTGYIQSVRNKRNTIKRQMLSVYKERVGELNIMVEITQDRNQAISDQMKKASELAGVSHDIHHNLFDIKLQLSILKKNEKNLDAVENINDSLSYLKKLTATLIKENKQVMLTTVEDVQLDTIFKTILDTFDNKAKNKSIKFNYVNTINQKIPGSSVILKRLLENVVRNAVQHTTKGGVLLTARLRRGYVLLQVFDTGKGMPASKVKELLSYKPQASSEGFGIGMVVIKTLCEQEGYELGIRSKVGKGTVVSIKIPI